MAKSVFALPEFRPYEARFTQRAIQFATLRRYYAGTIYDDSGFRMAHKLYAQTKALFSFLARAVDLDVALVPGVMGAWALDEDTPNAQIEAQAQLYEWSRWGVEGDSWLEDGATLGEAMIKVVPDLDRNLIQLQRLKPELALVTRHVDPESGAPVDLALIIDRNATDSSGGRYEYAEAITPMAIRTYRDGDPFGYNGNPDRYDNPVQFVPVVVSRNDSECRPTFAKALPQVNSVNELASYINNIIGRHAEPQWAISGAEQNDLIKSGANVWFLPAGAKAEALLAQIDVPGALAFIQEIKQETKSNLPELAFDDLRAKAQIATETLAIQLIELDAKIWKMRRRYDSGLTDAHRMAAMAGVALGIRGLEPLLAPHQMDAQRPVRPVSRLEEIQLEQAELGLEMQRQLSSGEGLTRLATLDNAPAQEPADASADNGRQ